MPLRATALHGLYCTGLTVPFVYVHWENDIPGWMSKAKPFVQYVYENASLMTGCTSFMATALFLILSFRINRAVSRWWEGRVLFGEMLAEARGLQQTAVVYLNNKEATMELSLMTYAYVRSVEFHLRHEGDGRHREVFSKLFSEDKLEAFLASPCTAPNPARPRTHSHAGCRSSPVHPLGHHGQPDGLIRHGPGRENTPWGGQRDIA